MLSDKLKSLYLPVVNVPSAWKMRSVFLWLFLSSLGTLVRSGMLFEIFGKQRLSWNLKWKRLGITPLKGEKQARAGEAPVSDPAEFSQPYGGGGL